MPLPVCGLQYVRLPSGRMVPGRWSRRGKGPPRIIRGHYCHRIKRKPTAEDIKWCGMSRMGRCKRNPLATRNPAMAERAKRQASRNPWITHVRAYAKAHDLPWREALKGARATYCPPPRGARRKPDPEPVLLSSDDDEEPSHLQPQHHHPQMGMAMDPLSVPTSREAGTPCDPDATAAGRRLGGTVVRAGVLLRRPDARKTGIPGMARPRNRNDVVLELRECRRLAAIGVCPPVLWADDEAGCIVVPPLRRTLADVIREQHQRLSPRQQRRLLEICTDPRLKLQVSHVRYATFVFAEAPVPGGGWELFLLHPTAATAALRSGRRNYGEAVLRAIVAELHPDCLVDELRSL